MKRCPKCPEVYSDMMHFCPNDGNQLVAIVAQDPMIDTTLDGKYIIEAVIGKGGMGVVYRARHTNFNRQFAIKVLKSDLVTDPQAVKRFRNEANAAGAIRHPNAIAITDFNITPDGMAYLVMDYVEGRSLREILKKEGKQPFERTARLIGQVCDAVAAAHRKGIIHRDLKPDNIMVEITDDQMEMVHVLDFGIAKLSQNPAYSENITVGGAILGSPYYMSPEQCDGRQLDARSDIYSLGIILYEMLVGKVPFRAQTPWGLVKMHCSALPKPLRDSRPDIPVALEEVVLKALAKDVNDRHQSANELKRELEIALNMSGALGWQQSSTGGHEAVSSVPASTPAPPPPPSLPPPGSTMPLDPKLAQDISSEIGNQATVVQPYAQIVQNNPASLMTTPMKALSPAIQEALKAVSTPTEPSLEEQKLEELAQELEKEMNQFRAKKEGTASFSSTNKTPVPSQPETLQELTNELEQEMAQFDLKKAQRNSGSIPRAPLPPPPPPPSFIPSKPVFTPPPTTPTPSAVKSAVSNANNGGLAPHTEPAAPVAAVYGATTGSTTAQNPYLASTYDPIDIAEEFSLALPEMVEDVLLSVSETITDKAEVLARRVVEDASANLARIQEKIERSSPPPNITAQASPRPTPKETPRVEKEDIRPRPQGMVNTATRSDEDFRKKLVFLGIGAVVLILAVVAYKILFSKPKGPIVPPGQTTQGTTTNPDGTVIDNGNTPTIPEGMVLVKGKSYSMGINSPDDPLASPAHSVTVGNFLIDKYEITNRKYRDFVEATGYKAPPSWTGNAIPEGGNDLPVTGISWDDAVAYCQWKTKTAGITYRLPTEAEWEYVARHYGQSTFPWGNEWKATAANTKDIRKEQTIDVGSYRGGETPEGVSDLIGNAAEWTSSDLVAYPGSTATIPAGPLKVVRGGSYNSTRAEATTSHRLGLPANGGNYDDVGFRCVREVN